MARIVAAMGMTHSPGLVGWFDSAPPEEQEMAQKAFAEMRAHLRERQVDVIVLIGNDHLLNWPINNTPDYTVGIDDKHTGPADWYDDWLQQEEKFTVPGHSGLARHIVNEAARQGVAMASKRNMQFDDSVTVPTLHLNPDGRYRTIPINLNCTVPPAADQVQSYEFGIKLRQILESYPGDERIALVGTGGLSAGVDLTGLITPCKTTYQWARCTSPPRVAYPSSCPSPEGEGTRSLNPSPLGLAYPSSCPSPEGEGTG